VLKDVNGNPFWSSLTGGKGVAPYELVVQNAGNFIIQVTSYRSTSYRCTGDIIQVHAKQV
jgi:hypothetical protein